MADSTTGESPETRCIRAVGPGIFEEYLKQTFPAPMIELGFYNAENASDWLDMKTFMTFAAKRLQVAAQASLTSSPAPGTSSQRPSVPNTPVKAIKREPQTALLAIKSDDILDISSDSDTPTTSKIKAKKRVSKPQTTAPKPSNDKRKRAAPSDDSEPEILPKTSKPKKSKSKKKQKMQAYSESDSDAQDSDAQSPDKAVRITRQLTVPQLKTLTEVPSTWTIYDGAYLLDLSADSNEWKSSAGVDLSMAAIIKSQDQDSWGGGSAGHTKAEKCPSVVALDGQKCQLAEHECQGVYHCSELDMELLNNCRRYAPDADEMKALFQAERNINIDETSTPETIAIAFFKEAMKEPCLGKTDTGKDCPGQPVYRKYKKENFFGNTASRGNFCESAET